MALVRAVGDRYQVSVGHSTGLVTDAAFGTAPVSVHGVRDGQRVVFAGLCR